MNTYAWDAGFRHITAVNNAFGGETRISYSTTGMPTATWQGCGAAESARTTYDYNGMGLLTRETNPRGGNRIVMRRSDGLPVSETSANGMTIYYEYDSLGHLVAATRCGIELFRNTVDADGRITRTDYPDGTFETVEYDAMRRPVVLVDRAGRTEVLAYSAGSTVTNASLTCAMPGGALATTSIGMRHDTQLNIREVRNEGSVAVESYALDACDRVVAVTNAEGQVARMEYVLGDRISRTRRFDGSEVSYEWNAYGLKQAAYQSFTNNYLRMMDGSLSRASGPNGVIAYKYDKFGNTTNVVTEQGCVAQAFDSTGDIVRKTWSDGEVAYSYDRAGRVTNMVWTVAGLTLPFSCSYSPTNGALSSVEYPNGVFSERGYDVMDRIAKIGWRGYASSGSDTREYEYDNADNIVSISTASGEIINYAYDGRDRLVGESRSGESVAYIYDATGNRIGKSVNGNGAAEEYASNYLAGDRLAEWSRTDADIAVDAVTNATYSYAASGCTTNVLEHCANGSTREVSYAWTDDYRLSSVSVNGAEVAEYAYDALGNLISVANGGESFEILVENGHALADVTEDGSTLRVYMKAPGIDKWLGFVDMTGSSPVPYFYVTDHLGSVLAVTDANGNLVERYTYDAWGKVLSVTDANGNALTRSAIGNRILWQGREYSWTTGLYYFRNRWYDPEISRWISRDMIGINGGLNLYAYCGNSPVVRADPNGKFWVQVCVAVGITYLVYSFVDYILTINRTMESADVNDIRDISKALDCCTETAIRITPIFGPPTPDPTLPITDKTTDLIMRPIWKRIFDRVRPTTRKKCK